MPLLHISYYQKWKWKQKNKRWVGSLPEETPPHKIQDTRVFTLVHTTIPTWLDWGFSFEKQTLRLASCAAGSVAARSEQARACVGMTLTRLNGEDVYTHMVRKFPKAKNFALNISVEIFRLGNSRFFNKLSGPRQKSSGFPHENFGYARNTVYRENSTKNPLDCFGYLENLSIFFRGDLLS